MIINFAIHKNLDITPEEIYNNIRDYKDMPGINISIYKDCWIIAEPENLHIGDWQRNKDDYRVEEREVAYKEIILEKPKK